MGQQEACETSYAAKNTLAVSQPSQSSPTPVGYVQPYTRETYGLGECPNMATTPEEFKKVMEKEYEGYGKLTKGLDISTSRKNSKTKI
jgi:hypothetical protein